MKHLRRWMGLFALLLLLTLAACRPNGEQAAVTSPTVSPTVGVEETLAPSGQPSQTPQASELPSETQSPAQDQGGGGGSSGSGGAATPAPAVKPTQKPAVKATPAPAPKPTAKPTPTPAPETHTCYLSIECKTILSRMEDLTPGKESLVPSDGVILSRKAISFEEGESVFDVLLRATQTYGIHMEYEYTPAFGSHYIEGINNLYEFDCGAGSGWMYYVNGVKPNYGVSKYTVKDGDVIEFKYTCDLGFDL